MRFVLAMIGFGLGGSIGLLMFSKTLLGGVLLIMACLLLVALVFVRDALAPLFAAARVHGRRPRRRTARGHAPAMKPAPMLQIATAPKPARVVRPILDAGKAARARTLPAARVTHSAIILSDPESDKAVSARKGRPDPMRAAVTDPVLLPA